MENILASDRFQFPTTLENKEFANSKKTLMWANLLTNLIKLDQREKSSYPYNICQIEKNPNSWEQVSPFIDTATCSSRRPLHHLVNVRRRSKHRSMMLSAHKIGSSSGKTFSRKENLTWPDKMFTEMARSPLFDNFENQDQIIQNMWFED